MMVAGAALETENAALYRAAMAALNSEQLLSLVQQALKDIDDRPVDVTARRVVRIANLLGDTVLAVYLGYELKSSGGLPRANAEDTRRLMADPSMWSTDNGPDEEAMTTYLKAREVTAGPNLGKITHQSLAEVENFLSVFRDDQDAMNDPDFRRQHGLMLDIRERVRHKVFVALCAWERQLTYANVNEQIFERFRSKVDAYLAQGAPAVLDQFSAVYRRLREAAKDPSKPVPEELSQAATSCRRILKAVADHLYPGVAGAKSEGGQALNDAAYRNRIYEFVKSNVASDATAETIREATGGVHDRFSALDKLASKGVHADLGLREAELCAIHTYLVAGELITLGKAV